MKKFEHCLNGLLLNGEQMCKALSYAHDCDFPCQDIENCLCYEEEGENHE